MISFIFFLAQTFTLTVDVIGPSSIETIECQVVPTDLGDGEAILHYRLQQKKLYSMVDCTLLFSDSFED